MRHDRVLGFVRLAPQLGSPTALRLRIDARRPSWVGDFPDSRAGPAPPSYHRAASHSLFRQANVFVWVAHLWAFARGSVVLVHSRGLPSGKESWCQSQVDRSSIRRHF